MPQNDNRSEYFEAQTAASGQAATLPIKRDEVPSPHRSPRRADNSKRATIPEHDLRIEIAQRDGACGESLDKFGLDASQLAATS